MHDIIACLCGLLSFMVKRELYIFLVVFWNCICTITSFYLVAIYSKKTNIWPYIYESHLIITMHGCA